MPAGNTLLKNLVTGKATKDQLKRKKPQDTQISTNPYPRYRTAKTPVRAEPIDLTNLKGPKKIPTRIRKPKPFYNSI